MPIDLTVALLVMSAIAAAMFEIGRRLGGYAPRRASRIVASGAVAVLLLYALWLKDNPVLTRLLPAADVIVWGNLQLPAATLLTGVAWSSAGGPRWQRMLLVMVLLGIGLWREAGPVLGCSLPSVRRGGQRASAGNPQPHPARQRPRQRFSQHQACRWANRK